MKEGKAATTSLPSTLVPLQEGECPCSPHPQAGLGPTPLTLWWMHTARQEPFQPQGQKWGLSSAPYPTHHRHTLQVIGT